MNPKFEIICIPLDSQPGRLSPNSFEMEVITTIMFPDGVISPEAILSVCDLHPLIHAGAPTSITAVAAPHSDWSLGKGSVANAPNHVNASVDYTGNPNFPELLGNLRHFFLRETPVKATAQSHDAWYDSLDQSHFVDVHDSHERITDFRSAVRGQVASAMGIQHLDYLSKSLHDEFSYLRERWLNSYVQTVFLDVLARSVDGRTEQFLGLTLGLTPLSLDVAKVAGRLRAINTPSGVSVLGLQGTTAKTTTETSVHDPNAASHAAMTNSLVARSCGFVTRWTVQAPHPLNGDYVIAITPPAVRHDIDVIWHNTAFRSGKVIHPLSYEDRGVGSTTNAGLALLNDANGEPRFKVSSINAEAAIIQATLLQSANSLSNPGYQAISPQNTPLLNMSKLDDSPPQELSDEHHGFNEYETSGVTVSAPIADLVRDPELTKDDRETSLPCLYLEDVLLGYRFDLQDPKTGDFRSTHQTTESITFNISKAVISGTQEDYWACQQADPTLPSQSNEIGHYNGLSRGQRFDYANFMGSRLIADGDSALFSSKTVSYPNSTSLAFGEHYAYRLRTVFLGGVGHEADDPGLAHYDRRYSQLFPFARARAFKPGTLLTGAGEALAKNGGRPHDIYLTDDRPTARTLLYPTPIGTDEARFLGTFLSGAREEHENSDCAFITNLPAFVAANLGGAYYCDPDVAEVSISLRFSNGPEQGLKPEPVYESFHYCEVYPPRHIGPVVAAFGLARDWRNFRPIEILLSRTDRRNPTLAVDHSKRRVTVLLPLAGDVEITITPIVSPDKIRSTAAYAASTEALRLRTKLSSAAGFGFASLPLVSERLRVVSAPPRPLSKPVLESELSIPDGNGNQVPVLKRRPKESYARVFGRVEIDAPSSGSLKLVATWSDIDDSPAYPQFVLNSGSTASEPWKVLFSRKPPENPVANARLRLSPFIALPGADIAPAVGYFDFQQSETMVFMGRDQLASDGTPIRVCELDFHDGQRKRATIKPVATGRFSAEYPDAKDALERSGASILADVPSTIALPAPKISHVLPISRIQTASVGDRRTTSREYALRVYVDRPWFLSGPGERLAIGCCSDSDVALPADLLDKYLTQWGEDPLQRIKLEASRFSPRASNFRALDATNSPFDPRLYDPALPETGAAVIYRDAVLRDAKSKESENIRTSLASFALHWDASLKLWYCDIVTGVGFVGWCGFAFYRHQPQSLVGYEISLQPTWVTAAFLLGERITSLRDANGIKVTVGPMYDGDVGFYLEERSFRNAVSEVSPRRGATRYAMSEFIVEGGRYFQTVVGGKVSKLELVKTRFGFEVGSTPLGGEQ